MDIREDLEKRLHEKHGVMMSLEDVAEVLQLTTCTVRSMCARKDLTAKKTGLKWIIPTQSVVNYIAGEPSPTPKWVPGPRNQKLIVR